MSSIGINLEQIAKLRAEVEEELEPFHKSFQNIEACDGGIASGMIGLISSAAFEAARYSGDTFHTLMVLTTEVANDHLTHEDEVVESIQEFVSELDRFV